MEWEAGGCFKVSATYILYKEHQPLSYFEDYTGKSLNYVKSMHDWQSSENLLNETNNNNPLSFSHFLNFSFPQEIDVLIALQCDTEWGAVNEKSSPYAPPQSHLVLARTNENYSAENNGYIIKSEKTVYKYLKNLNINGGGEKNVNPYLRRRNYYQAKFQKCFRVGSTNDFEDHNFLFFSTDEEDKTIKINGQIDYFNNKFKAFVFENGDISYCDSFHLGKNLDIFQSFDDISNFYLLNFENTTSFFQINTSNKTLSYSLETEKSLSSFYLSEILGRSILLYDGKEFLVGQFNILQNYQCNNEAKNCLGEDIEDSDGICLLMNEFKSKETEEFLIKIAIHSNHTKGGLGTKIVSNFKLLNDFYEGIEKIILRNADSDAEFKIIKEKTTSDIILSETKPLSLNPKVALGNRILILGEKGGKMFKIGVCDIALMNVPDLYYQFQEEIHESGTSSWVGIVALIMVGMTVIVVLCIQYKHGY